MHEPSAAERRALAEAAAHGVERLLAGTRKLLASLESAADSKRGSEARESTGAHAPGRLEESERGALIASLHADIEALEQLAEMLEQLREAVQPPPTEI